MNGVTTTRRLHSTDFIRLKTLTFGVTVPKTWTRKIGVNSLRLYASATTCGLGPLTISMIRNQSVLVQPAGEHLL